jgi:hypothetical protein
MREEEAGCRWHYFCQVTVHTKLPPYSTFIQNCRRIQPKIEYLRSNVFGQLPEKMFKGQVKSHHAGYSFHTALFTAARQY